jgi:hypothetical protein
MYKGNFGENQNYSNVIKGLKQCIVKYPSTITNLKDVSTKYNDLPLQQFCIKGSFNSALFTYTPVSGIISLDNIMYILTQGCRVLDFELYYLKNGDEVNNAYVGYNPYEEAVLPSSDNVLLFSEVLNEVVNFGFSRQNWRSDIYGNDLVCPNPNDPLFIQIRFKTVGEYKLKLYNLVNEIFNSGSYDDVIYLTNKEEINSNTVIQNLAGKIVILFPFDQILKNNKEDIYDNFFPCSSESLKNFNFATIIVNGYSLKSVFYSNIDLTKYKTTPLKTSNNADDDKTVISTSWNIVYPDINLINNYVTGDNFNNFNILTGIKDYGYQIYMMQYYNEYQGEKIHCKQINKMFNTYRTAFIPMRVVLFYIN